MADRPSFVDFILKSLQNGVSVAGGLMAVITVRNVPDDLHRALSKLARKNRRSLQQQVLIILEQARQLDQESPVDVARKLRKKFSGRQLGDSVAEIREDRDR